jgi:endonuclease/exonuclease/phosphatase (EEP) superfamily protein YafD
MRRVRLFVSANLGALFGFLPMSEPGLVSGGAASVDSVGSDTIRLLTWNVHKHLDSGWNRDFHRLLDEYRPDIVHLQEARIDSMVAAFACRPEAWCWMASPNLSMPGPGGPVGAFTATRAPLQEGVAMLSDHAEPILNTRKPMLRCGLPLRGSPAPILCLNIHSLNFKLGLAGYGSQLDSILAAAAAHHGPVIFSGDFNTWSRWRMELLQRKMAAAGLRRVEFAGEGPLPSWFSARSLDHVFYSHGRLRADPASARILAEIRSSDHAPLVVDFLP